MENEDVFMPDYLFFAGIIRSAIIDKDAGYFASGVFRGHCRKYDIDPEEILKRLSPSMKTKIYYYKLVYTR